MKEGLAVRGRNVTECEQDSGGGASNLSGAGNNSGRVDRRGVPEGDLSTRR
jgi:hypothetical protein